MKISLIQPKFNSGIDMIQEPLGLAYLASFLKNKNYKNVKIYSSFLESERKIINSSIYSDVVGITTNIAMVEHANILISKIKSRNPDVIIVVGGSYASALPEVILKYNRNIDYVVRGEGEVTFYELIEAINSNKDVDNIAGISYRNGDKIFHNRDRSLIQDINTIPNPDRDLFDQERFIEKSFNLSSVRSVLVVGSRGCPFQCIHCASKCVWSREWRTRSAENIITEIESLVKKYRVNIVGFADSVFSFDKKRVEEFCKLLKKKNMKISWWCQDNISLLNKDILSLMKKSGCIGIAVGIESGSSKILKELKKGLSVEKTKSVFKTAKDIGIKLSANFMIGSFSENYDTIRETEKLFEEINPDYCGLSIFTPLPGSESYKIAKQKGYISEDFNWNNVRYDKAIMPTNQLSIKDINRMYKRLYKKMFNLEMVHLNILTLFKKGIRELLKTSPTEYGFLCFKTRKYLKLLFKNR